ncbi:iron uptake transporter permease EfeU [Streptomyces sp. ICBB 8177]|uniref:iron uptake transporter permease EfeU n=1 Tax=Streptomyces sp. ICBB 8177 TaxID=563922 RepID=UPI001F544D89|nr:iron uptake transporter permease EfeU [Streptomyces sp. ICBB 8177]
MWADGVPNLLIGLREGLEAGLIVTILLAALRKSGAAAADTAGTDGERRAPSSAPIWLGVIGAVALAGSFAAVLTFSTSVLSSTGQEAVGGVLSVLAVGLVTAMVFWMRRTARTLSGELRGKVEHALKFGSGALAVTAFLAVGREGLETTLFLWTAARTAGDTVAPLVGAGVGILAAAVLCRLLYQRAIRINLGTFFSRTALALIVIAAGVLAYGLGDVQDAGLLPGQSWIAFDLSSHIDANSWWVTLISGVTELSVKMTVLQVAAWLAYLLVVIPAFVRADRPAVPRAEDADGRTSGAPAWVRRLRSGVGGALDQRPWTVGSALVLVPVVAATVAITLLPGSKGSDETDVTVTGKDCAPEFKSAHTGKQTFSVENRTGKAGEINLDNAAGAIVAEIETLGPGTTAEMAATLGPGTYTFTCMMGSTGVTRSATVQASGHSDATTVAAVKPVTVKDLTRPNDQYQAYAAGVLKTLASDVAKVRADLGRNDVGAAKTDWLAAQLDWERVGASYNSFGDDGLAVDGLPDGLQDGVNDPGFTGLHRLEYGLYHGQSAKDLVPVTDTLTADIVKIQKNLTSDDLAGDPTNLPIRAHEILEDALRDHLSGIDDQGSGMAYAQTAADVDVTRTVLGELAPLIDARSPKLMGTVTAQLDTLDKALQATRDGNTWQSPDNAPQARREQVNAAVSAALETLSSVPDLLEVPPSH